MGGAQNFLQLPPIKMVLGLHSLSDFCGVGKSGLFSWIIGTGPGMLRDHCERYVIALLFLYFA